MSGCPSLLEAYSLKTDYFDARPDAVRTVVELLKRYSDSIREQKNGSIR